MKRLLLSLVAAVFAAAAGCTPPVAEGQLAQAASVAATVAVPTLEFDANWSVGESSPPVSGGQATIVYDIARLPSCRATYMSYPAWDVLAWWSTDGGPAYSQSVTTLSNGARVGTPITIDVPPGHDLALWFEASDEYGCLQWDSNYGRNFHFALQPGPATIHFPFPGWDDQVDGTLKADAPILVDYDIRRLSECRQDYNGLASWDVTLFYSFDGGAAATATLTRISGSGRVAAPALIQAPAGAKQVAMWFENVDRTGCTAWDSRYGANYVFDLQ